ncbi:MAG: RHS repeat-associated core domain-containing protein, partial [Pseudomonadota bacterium]
FGEDAYCVRTWGDGGIYDHVIDYDKMGKVTYVTNSLGHTTTYKMNAVGCVVKVTDALGGATAYEYDERSLQKVKETDPVGGETTWEYDARGNCVKTVGPDGATVHLAFNADGQPVRAIDSMKGEWQWGYDERGHLVGRIDSVDRRVQFLWKSDRDESRPRAGAERPKRLAAFVDPAGQQTEIGYDGYGNVAALRTPDGAESRWRYDNLGRCVAAFDAKGNAQKREHDPLGRVVRVWEADGNLRQLDHDPEGNIMRARDKQRDVRFAYQGMGRVVARTEAGTTVEFAYDTEERLRAIKNEHGFAYRFDLGPTGAVDVEWGFDDIRRQYQRDKAGRVTKVFRPDSRETEYTYDPAGRVAAVKHSDGTSETYAYRPDGELVLAKNDDAAVTLERDLLGRVTKELVGDDWVASDYDALGMRIRVRSSKGLDQRIQRNAVGQFIGVRATVGGATSGGAGESAPWEARVRRDILGLEIERTLPGGLQARWERDAIGRPVRQEVHAAGEFRRAVQYTWDINDRLRMVVDATRGPTHYEHDDFGNLAAATYADGSVDLRMPDAVGNLFRTKDRSDRKYGPAGQLLEARGEDGGVTRYEYDAEGNLVWKIEVAAGRENEGQGDEGDGRVWTYWWNVAGLLVKVIRPDGNIVQFVYDALGRRLSKTFREQTTRWIWDGNFPLHEWVQVAQVGVLQVVLVDAKSLDEGTARRRQAERASSSAQGPPLHMSAAALCGPAVAENLARTPSERRLPTPQDGDAETPITWLFEPETFAPMAKVLGRSSCAIITNHLGAPVAMYSAQGEEVWSATIDVYGDLHDLAGDRRACPFRWPGQYEDWETGLYYNRFRYYDSQQGGFISADPIGLQGGLALYQYVQDPLSWKDPLGLSGCGPTAAEELPQMKGMSVSEAERTLASRGFQKTHVSNSPGKNQTWSHPDGSEVRIHPYGNQSTGPWKSGNNAHVHKESPAGAQLTDRGIPSTNPAETHIGISNPPDLPTVRNGRAHGAGTM